MTILLVSGLTLEKPNSFNRQLTLLGAALKKQGACVLLTGPSLEGLENSKMAVNAALLLGYTDQFQLVQQQASHDFPLFLWSQFSRAPDRSSLMPFIPVPLTAKTAQYIRESGLQRIGPIIPHGIDLSLYLPLNRDEKKACRAAWGLHNGLVIGTVGAHSRRKRLDLVVKTIHHLKRMGLEAELIIKTDRNRSLDGEDLEELARVYEVLSSIHIVTRELNEPELRSLYGCLDIYINLSEWEGFCIPIVEALACGTPVACLPLQGPGEIVPYDRLFIQGYRQFDENGTLLCEADPEEAAKIILHAAEKPAILEELGGLGTGEAQMRFDIQEVARQWLELIKKWA